MKLLVIDGNSIVNRAFYGIKLLSTKDGRFTNGIYGFLTILIKLTEQVKPDSVAIAFDLRTPTFRHKMYKDYKGTRKGMPDELAGQMEPLKEILSAMGYALLSKEGWEADDILGSLAAACGENDECFIATGDRDSLQLVNNNVKVLLATTKMGRAETVIYDAERIKEEYGVSPAQLIDIKALMGDSSDNIPGVAGIGKKTAGELIAKFGSIDFIYENIDDIDIKEGVRQKLKNDKDKAYLSYKLGTISLDAPVERDISAYIPKKPQENLSRLLADLELFNIIKKLDLSAATPVSEPVAAASRPAARLKRDFDYNELLLVLKRTKKAYFAYEATDGAVTALAFNIDNDIYQMDSMNLNFQGFFDEAMSDGEIIKYTHDVKTLYSICINSGVKLSGIGFDTLLAAYILNPSSSDYEISRLVQEYAVSTPLLEGESDSVLRSAADITELTHILKNKIEENSQQKLLCEIELPLARVLAYMESYGFLIDAQGIKRFGKELQIKIDGAVKSIYAQAGCEFNINSPKQLGEALFEKMGLPSKKKTKSGYSTAADVLSELADEYEIVRTVLEYRAFTKLKSTYCDGLVKAIDADGRIHSTLNQTETRTGRISSAEPNLQNIPVRSELGRELRRFFKAKDGCVLVDADYSQIELRVLSCISGDENMLRAFNNGDDIHTITASQVFNTPPESVTPIMRTRAKAVNFGIVYGIGAFSLAKDIGVTRKEADMYIKGYLHHYSGVSAYMSEVVERAKEKGFVETLFGRRRYLPELSSSNAVTRAFGERVARNMPIQGTAADIIKIAMIRVFERMERENMKARLILQVHDELIIEAPLNEAEKAARIVDEEMENACKMSVRLTADVHTGKTWYQAKG